MSKSKGNTLDPLDIIDGIEFDVLLEKSTKGILIDGHKAKIENYLKRILEVELNHTELMHSDLPCSTSIPI